MGVGYCPLSLASIFLCNSKYSSRTRDRVFSCSLSAVFKTIISRISSFNAFLSSSLSMAPISHLPVLFCRNRPSPSNLYRATISTYYTTTITHLFIIYKTCNAGLTCTIRIKTSSSRRAVSYHHKRINWVKI